MRNYLLKILDKYFEEILVIEGKLTVLESFLIAKKMTLLKRIDNINMSLVQLPHIEICHC
jgi:hypothetical protein